MTSLEYVQQRKIVAIVRGLAPEYMVRLGHALEEGGIGMMEVTYNQRAPETWSDTAKAIEAVGKEFGERLLVGAGTVIKPEQVSLTYNAGGRYTHHTGGHHSHGKSPRTGAISRRFYRDGNSCSL